MVPEVPRSIAANNKVVAATIDSRDTMIVRHCCISQRATRSIELVSIDSDSNLVPRDDGSSWEAPRDSRRSMWRVGQLLHVVLHRDGSRGSICARLDRPRVDRGLH